MADLDVSRHSLNLSQTKQKYSFPRSKRFNESNKALYISSNKDATPFIKFPALFPKEPLLLVMVIKRLG